MRNKLNFLYELLQELAIAPRTPGNDAMLKEAKQDILATHAEMLTGYKERSQLQDAAKDEPLSMAHVGRTRKRARQQVVESIETDDGTVLRSPADISNLFREVYSSKFRRPAAQTEGDEEILREVVATISEEDNLQLCRGITAEEVLKAAKKSPRAKAPGEDGIPVELYLVAWDIVGNRLTEMIDTMFQQQHIPAEVMEGVITLIPKGGTKPWTVKDLRPITLLDADAKLLARVMATRLAEHAAKLLHPHQVRAGDKRTMGGALCDLRDLLSAFEALRTPGCVLSTDFSGAFDAVRHDFLFAVLTRRGVAPQFVRALQAMYTGAASRTRINGELTAAFQVERSVRQGCPLSVLLFALVLAPLLFYLEKRLTGLALANCTMRTSAYADDAFYILRHHQEATIVQRALQLFGRESGLAVNAKKSGALAAGGWDTAVSVGFDYVERLKILGIIFTRNIDTTCSANWDRVLASVRGVLQDNATRALGLRQRAAYAQTYGLSRLWHTAQVLPVPRSVAKGVTGAVGKFVWRGVHNVLRGGQHRQRQRRPRPPRRADQVPRPFHRTLAGYPGGNPGHLRGGVAAHAAQGFPHRRTPVQAVGRGEALRDLPRDAHLGRPALVPRVAAKHPTTNWGRVWKNLQHPAIPEEARESWWVVVHDLVATRHRAQRHRDLPDMRRGGRCEAPPNEVRRWSHHVGVAEGAAGQGARGPPASFRGATPAGLQGQQ